MVSYSIISELIINILQVLLIRKMMELFLPATDENKKKMGTVFVCYYLLTIVLISIFHRAAVYGICNYLSIIGLTLFYQGSWKKRFWVSLAIFATDLACALVVYFAFAQKLIEHQQAVRTLLLLICVTLIDHITYPADSGEIVFDKKQTCILIMVPAASTFILCVLLYGRYEGVAPMLICISILIINLGIF